MTINSPSEFSYDDESRKPQACVDQVGFKIERRLDKYFKLKINL